MGFYVTGNLRLVLLIVFVIFISRIIIMVVLPHYTAKKKGNIVLMNIGLSVLFIGSDARHDNLTELTSKTVKPVLLAKVLL